MFAQIPSEVRQLMVEEIALDHSMGGLYQSPRLTSIGAQDWPSLLMTAATNHSDGWLASQLRDSTRMRVSEVTRTGTRQVPHSAPETLAEGEFNRYLCRAVCRASIEWGPGVVLVYRAKYVDEPRASSEALIGAKLDARQLLEQLRTRTANVPGGPNSGLSVRLP